MLGFSGCMLFVKVKVQRLSCLDDPLAISAMGLSWETTSRYGIAVHVYLPTYIYIYAYVCFTWVWVRRSYSAYVFYMGAPTCLPDV